MSGVRADAAHGPGHEFASLCGRVVIVTGAGRGFGRLIALALVARGARVLGTAARASAELAETARLAHQAGGGEFRHVLADVADPNDCERTVEAALDAFGRIDGLVNNAARGPLEANGDYFERRPRFWEVPLDAWRRIVETNLVGAYQMARLVVPGMLERGFGRIVNLSTSRSTMVMTGLAAYGASKAALEASTVTWARELEGSGVTANVLLPGGPSDTAFIPGGDVGRRSDPAWRPGKEPPGREGAVASLLPPEIVVPPALWLLSDAAAHVNGRRLVARDWDLDLPIAEAAARALRPQHDAPQVM